METPKRSAELTYYYNVKRSELLKKITCSCGRVVSKGNYLSHTRTTIHHKRLKKNRLQQPLNI